LKCNKKLFPDHLSSIFDGALVAVGSLWPITKGNGMNMIWFQGAEKWSLEKLLVQPCCPIFKPQVATMQVIATLQL
jgi:hypothetical protein